MRKTMGLPFSIPTALAMLCASFIWAPRGHAEEPTAPLVVHALGTGTHTLLLSSGASIPEVSGLNVVVYMGVKMFHGTIRIEGKDREIWFNPDHIVGIQSDEVLKPQ